MTTLNSPRAMAKLALAACLAGILLHAAAAFAAPAGIVHFMSGVLSAKGSDGKVRILRPKSEVYSGDLLSTEKKTFALIKFTDGGEVLLRPESQLIIDSYRFQEDDPDNNSNSFNLVKGGLRAITGVVGKLRKENYEMKSQIATLAIRGTRFGMFFCQENCASLASPSGNPPANGLHVDVSEGAVVLTNAGGSQLVNAGEFAYVQASNVPPVLVPADQAVKPPPPPSNMNEGLFGKTGSNGCVLR